VNAYLIDAIIGFSVVYKGFDNLDCFRQLFGQAPDEYLAVLIFGMFHGLGLGSKLQDLGIDRDGLVGNLLSFNLGVELGQFAALIILIYLLRYITYAGSRMRVRFVVNIGLMIAGFSLMFYQLSQAF
jgi:hypothetical protein